ncbi:VOC family protein [Aciditerrimonas ferrireducens]|uniref:VOC family protein n=1 Tax=Aciditerrimonas ferrireducens TaxID=667306 RepID=UPI0020067615|nr:VOC family protein [Aciditerrimonas ferrireducens]MCK4176241.1 VOC family protein [Aciditerrimonas ferrireducens]
MSELGFDIEELRQCQRPKGVPFRIQKIGHVVLNCRDIRRSVRFYTEVLGFSVSDVYPEELARGGMVFMRYNHDHHGVALVGTLPDRSEAIELNHLAFEVATLDELFAARDHLLAHGVEIDFEGRRRAGCQISVEFRDPDGHRLELFWGVDQVGSDGAVRPSSEWKWSFSLREAVLDPVRGQDTTLLDRSRLDREDPVRLERLTARSRETQERKLGH